MFCALLQYNNGIDYDSQLMFFIIILSCIYSEYKRNHLIEIKQINEWT